MAEQDDGGPAMMPVKPDGTGMTTAQAIEIALMSYRAGRLSDHIAAAVAAHAISNASMKRAEIAYTNEAFLWETWSSDPKNIVRKLPGGDPVDTGRISKHEFIEKQQMRAAIRAAIGGEHG